MRLLRATATFWHETGALTWFLASQFGAFLSVRVTMAFSSLCVRRSSETAENAFILAQLCTLRALERALQRASIFNRKTFAASTCCGSPHMPTF